MARMGTAQVFISAELKSFEKQIGQVKNRIDSLLAPAVGSIKGFGLAFVAAGLAVAGSAAAIIKDLSDVAGQLTDLHDRTELSIETLSGLSLGLRETGSSLDDLAGAWARFQKNVMGADDEGEDGTNKMMEKRGKLLQQLEHAQKKYADAVADMKSAQHAWTLDPVGSDSKIQSAENRLDRAGEKVSNIRQKLDELDSEMGKKEAPFRRIGVSSQFLRDMIPDEALKLVADRISQITDPFEKSAVAQGLFGRGASKLLPLLSQGAAGIDHYVSEAKRLGTWWTAEDAQTMDRLGESIDRIWDSMKGVGKQGTIALAPLIESVAVAAQDFFIGIRQQIESDPQFLDRMTTRFTSFFSEMRSMWEGFTTWFGEHKDEIVAVLNELGKALKFFADHWEPILGTLVALKGGSMLAGGVKKASEFGRGVVDAANWGLGALGIKALLSNRAAARAAIPAGAAVVGPMLESGATTFGMSGAAAGVAGTGGIIGSVLGIGGLIESIQRFRRGDADTGNFITRALGFNFGPQNKFGPGVTEKNASLEELSDQTRQKQGNFVFSGTLNLNLDKSIDKLTPKEAFALLPKMAEGWQGSNK